MAVAVVGICSVCVCVCFFLGVKSFVVCVRVCFFFNGFVCVTHVKIMG